MILISDNLTSEKIDCVCQVVEVDLLGSTLDKIVWELIKKPWCYRGWTECSVVVTKSEDNTLLTD